MACGVPTLFGPLPCTSAQTQVAGILQLLWVTSLSASLEACEVARRAPLDYRTSQTKPTPSVVLVVGAKDRVVSISPGSAPPLTSRCRGNAWEPDALIGHVRF